jgi:hypothetical protein
MAKPHSNHDTRLWSIRPVPWALSLAYGSPWTEHRRAAHMASRIGWCLLTIIHLTLFPSQAQTLDTMNLGRDIKGLRVIPGPNHQENPSLLEGEQVATYDSIKSFIADIASPSQASPDLESNLPPSDSGNLSILGMIEMTRELLRNPISQSSAFNSLQNHLFEQGLRLTPLTLAQIWNHKVAYHRSLSGSATKRHRMTRERKQSILGILAQEKLAQEKNHSGNTLPPEAAQQLCEDLLKMPLPEAESLDNLLFHLPTSNQAEAIDSSAFE